ncbi:MULTISPECIES: hypothetical protein [Pseudoalteromonas]|uniref:Uncharacterized protein n=1 Tax=Pseudoalteromonas viridis TaxID=339617 RepID=A0ABX7V238_9GAMM|nr:MULTISPECIES: hypothetical protein [Pseudoalteromonas]QTL34948.1 hypothetical protein J5X90_15650 [Pseudoalteromonas viridis]
MKKIVLSLEQNADNFLFKLSPKATSTDWDLTYYDAATQQYEALTQDTQFNVEFELGEACFGSNISALARRALASKQQAVFIVEMDDTSTDGDWRFWQNGISLSSEQDEQDYTLNAQVQNQGKTLVLTINNVFSNAALCAGEFDKIDFRFVAVRLNKSAGQLNEIFYSQDPRVGVRRNKPA